MKQIETAQVALAGEVFLRVVLVSLFSDAYTFEACSSSSQGATLTFFEY
jgi:hypothetical protein